MIVLPAKPPVAAVPLNAPSKTSANASGSLLGVQDQDDDAAAEVEAAP